MIKIEELKKMTEPEIHELLIKMCNDINVSDKQIRKVLKYKKMLTK